MDFLNFLENYEHEDVSEVRCIIASNREKEDTIIREAFNGEYTSKQEAILNLKNYFISEDTAPKGVDVEYVKEHMDELNDKMTYMSEGDIKIIIHNHEGDGEPHGKGKGKPMAMPPIALELEGDIPKKRGRGRPKKNAVEEPVVETEEEPVIESEEEDIKDIKNSIDKMAPIEEDSDEIDEDELIVKNATPSKDDEDAVNLEGDDGDIDKDIDASIIKWSDIEDKLDALELGDESDDDDDDIEESKTLKDKKEKPDEMEESFSSIVRKMITESQQAWKLGSKGDITVLRVDDDNDSWIVVTDKDDNEIAQGDYNVGDDEARFSIDDKDYDSVDDILNYYTSGDEMEESDSDQLVMKPKGKDLENELGQKGGEKDEI